MSIIVENKLANGIHHRIIHRIYQSILSFQNIIRFQGTCVCFYHLCPEVKYAHHCTNFHESYNCSATLCGRLLYRISPTSVKKCENGRQKFIYIINEVPRYHQATFFSPVSCTMGDGALSRG